ncbi:AGE family epimerase/isomerase [Mucilaginibacter sp. FT3.2]|uniref:AGE family epimerase/isomerase n=1 Tax=Mucilaginibacter sp. FT3.2 TaxID=2723090 RepID=UPI00160844FD|nr:AGE family epimerase/isomerase [Mucilaginibacter sp. FT3.2]MBB6231502.1 mannobiose 2-epimerase [Mucilaginibacter sp. FT3.2]
MKLKIASLLFFTGAISIASAQDNRNEKLKIAAEMQTSMVDKLLKPWYPAAIDTADGGFLSAFSYNFKPVGSQDKMIVTQARHVWSNSKAAELFPNVAWYKQGAQHGFKFLRDVLWDKTYGGFYTFTDKKGNVKQGGFAPKEAYGNSFAIYALAAYYQSSGDTSALNLAKKCFWWLEKHSHDNVYKGYYQHMQRDGTPIMRDATINPTAETGYKDQNSSIHLLESFTELYNVWPDSLLKARLNEMLLLVRDTIANSNGNLILFFKPDWTPISFRDSSDASIKRYHGLDHVSYGHNVETAYLMLEASHALGIDYNAKTEQLGKKMVDDALEHGWDNQLGGFYDEGYYFKNKPGVTITEDTKNWWAQAEGLNTLLLMAAKYPNDSHQYYQKFKMLWQYVQTYLIDQQNGDWYQGGIDKQPQYKTALKGQIWKGTYHNFRALMNCIAQLNPDKIPPSTPRQVKLTVKDNAVTLTWAASTDNRQVLGYNIYNNKTRIGFTPLLFFTSDKAFKHGTKLTLRALDLAGNESAMSKIAIR